MLLPKLYRIRQKLNPPVVPDVAAAVKAAIGKLDLQGRVKPGGRVAVTGGSRGVANIGTILKATCGCLKELGAQPFIVPAMGSHGGATAEGQVAVLTRYGVTPESMGVPILSSMETVEIARVDEIGKEVSGGGMDSNVIGRMPREVGLDPDAPRYVRILVRDLTAKTAGNAVGMGLADFATRRLADKVDFHATCTNVLTASVSLGAKLPIIFETDRDAIEGALKTIGLTESPDAKVARIKSTLALEYLHVSEALLPEVQAHNQLKQVSQPAPMTFDAQGNLSPF